MVVEAAAAGRTDTAAGLASAVAVAATKLCALLRPTRVVPELTILRSFCDDIPGYRARLVSMRRASSRQLQY